MSSQPVAVSMPASQYAALNDKSTVDKLVYNKPPLCTEKMEAKKEEIKKQCEIRFEEITDHIMVLLTHGTAEIFGAEMPKDEPKYFHAGAKFSIFSWEGAKV